MNTPGTFSTYSKSDEINHPSAVQSAEQGMGVEHLIPEQKSGLRNWVIVLQGYFHTKESVKEWATYIKDTSGYSAVYTYAWYDYWNKSFDLAGAELFDRLHTFPPYPLDEFDQIIVIGYSMGGLVARKMLSVGFNFTKLITVCTPNEGIFNHVADWGGAGAKSMHKDSPFIKLLNNNPTDKANRYKHFYIAYQYYAEKIKKTYPDDTILWSSSGQGAFLGENHYWIIYTWPYDIAGSLWPSETFAPHKLPGIKEYYPATAKPIIDYLQSL